MSARQLQCSFAVHSPGDQEATLTAPPNPSQIIQIGMGFFASKVLLSAVELQLFTILADKPATSRDIAMALQLNGRGVEDFLDALVSLDLLERQGAGATALYSNSAADGAFPRPFEPALYRRHSRDGQCPPLSFLGQPDRGIAQRQAAERAQGRGRQGAVRCPLCRPAPAGGLRGGDGRIQQGNFAALAETFDFSQYRSMCDIGGASGALAMAVARRHPKLTCISFDLPPVTEVARRALAAQGMSDRVVLQSGSFFDDPLPRADVVTMGNILHDWGLDTKKMLIRKAYEALPEGGCLIAIENVIDDDRRHNTFGLLMSLNMLIETNDGFDYTHAQFRSWCFEAGFRATELKPLTGPTSAAIAYK